VILNKADLADSQTVDNVRHKVHQINPKAFAVEAVHADVRMDLIDNHLMNSGFEGETCNTPWNRPETYTLKTDGIIGKDALARFVGGLSGSALRVKGFVQTEAGWIHIDAVGENCELKALRGMDEELKANQGIVIIGKDSTPFRDKVSGLWREAAGQDPVYIDE